MAQQAVIQTLAISAGMGSKESAQQIRKIAENQQPKESRKPSPAFIAEDIDAWRIKH